MMGLYERIVQCAKVKKVSIPDIEKVIGLGNGTIGKWKNSVPAADNLYKVANYLGKSVEFFLTGKSAYLTKQELELIAVYRSLDIRSQADFINYLLNLKK